MPLLQPREGDNDGGYAVQDYRAVRPDLGTIDDLRELATDLREHGHQPGAGPGAQPRRPRARVGAAGPGGRAGATATTSTSSPTATCPTPTSATLPEVFPDFAPGSFTWDDELRRLGLDDVQRVAVGPQLGQPRRARRVRRDHPVPGQPRRRGAPAGRHRVPVEAAGHQLPEPARGARDHPGAAHAWPGSRRPAVAFKAEAIVGPRDLVQYLGAGRARRPGQRPRLPQQPDGADLVDARHRQHRPGPARPRARCRRRRRPAPGSPTSAATTTSAGRSTTATPPPSGSTGYGAPALPVRLVRRRRSRARGPTGWSSRPTPPPATGGSAAPRPRWPGCDDGSRRRADGDGRRSPGSSWPTRSSPAGAASR